MKFADLGLCEPILRALHEEGYETPTPIQAKTIPHGLEGRDVLGCAQTGTGKTAAFALPILHRLAANRPAKDASRRPRCLVLAPTRELALQIGESFATYGKHTPLRHATIFGGVAQGNQVAALRRGIDVLIATPGRLLDLMQQGHVDLRGVGTLVLDEADRMLDMGFIRDIERIVAKLPRDRQTMLFSATMPKEIRRLADDLLDHPETVEVAPVASTAERVEQLVYFVDRQHKPALLAHLVDQLRMHRAIVFTRTKHGADRVVRQLRTRGIEGVAIHGNKSQGQRQRALESFRAGKTPLLIATDIAARGLDVDNVTHVVNYDLTHEPETYVHRIGRTARAGESGTAVSLCDRDERENLDAIQRLIRRELVVCNDHPPLAPISAPAETTAREPRRVSTQQPRQPRGPRPQAQAHGNRANGEGNGQQGGRRRRSRRRGPRRA